MRLDEDTVDISPFGCRHMSGNGKEWTDTLANPLDLTVADCADKGLPPHSLVLLRGRSYRASRPLRFDQMEQDTGARDPQEASAEIGFRVVLHP